MSMGLPLFFVLFPLLGRTAQAISVRIPRRSVVSLRADLYLKDSSLRGNESAGKSQALACGVLDVLTAESHLDAKCPEACPLFVEQEGNSETCDFVCVAATTSACAAANPKKTVADERSGICRSCWVNGCLVCNEDGTDTCQECKYGYSLVRGYCVSKFVLIPVIMTSIILIILFLVIVWVIGLQQRRVTNLEGLNEGLAMRARSRIHKPKVSPDDPRELWPLTTNLLRENVAGPGLMLQFNFQVVIILWALGVAATWYLLGMTIDHELLNLGLASYDTMRDSCIVIKHGRVTQLRLLWVKEGFCYGLYIVTFLLVILYAIRQLRIFQHFDERTVTHKDFCALLTNLPHIKGTVPVEEELKKVIQDALNQPVVGISVCWDFAHDYDDLVYDALHEDRLERLAGQGVRLVEYGSEGSSANTTPRQMSKTWPESYPMLVPVYKKWHYLRSKVDQTSKRLERICLKHAAPKLKHQEEETMAKNSSQVSRQSNEMQNAPGRDSDVVAMLSDMNTSAFAFVVFDTEIARNEAVAASAARGGVEYRDGTVQLESCDVEPDTVIWKNCAYSCNYEKFWLLAKGIVAVLVAISVWAVVFYLPYAYFLMSFNYAHGEEPSMVVQMLFTVLVCGGNALMYLVCSEVADRVGFKFHDQREVCYMMLYSFACVLNVILDLVVAATVARQTMVGRGIRTADGRLVGDVTSPLESFQSYPMQKSLGDNLYSYAFPSTFFIPFLFEPIGCIALPYYLMKWIVRTNTYIRGDDAEIYLMGQPMDLSRYADILLNVKLAVLIFYFPSGYTVRMFLALAFSNAVILMMDHYRVLRAMPACNFVSMDVDWWATWMLGLPLAFLLACAVFKGNFQYGLSPLQGNWLLLTCLLAFFGHMLLHTLALLYVVPYFGVKDMKTPKSTYKECAASLPFSWFNQNPIYCLRSKHIYNHEPYCGLCTPGREHECLLNENIGCFFTDKAAEIATHDFDAIKSSASSLSLSLECLSHQFSPLACKLPKCFPGSRTQDGGKSEVSKLEDGGSTYASQLLDKDATAVESPSQSGGRSSR